MNRTPLFVQGILTGVLAVAGPVWAGTLYEATDLGGILTPGGLTHLNDQGHLAGYLGGIAALWTPQEGLLLLGTFGGAHSRATALNNMGTVVGVSQTPDGHTHGFIWSAGQGMQDIGDGVYPSAVNDAGSVLGEDTAGTFVRAADGTEQRIVVPVDSLWIGAIGLDRGGRVGGNVGVCIDTDPVEGCLASVAHPFIWSAGEGVIDLGEGTQGYGVLAINEDGVLLGVYTPQGSGTRRVFVATRSNGLVDLGAWNGPGDPRAINQLLEIAGAYSVGGANLRPVLWEAPGFSYLDERLVNPIASGLGFGYAYAINNRGQVLTSNRSTDYLLSPVPSARDSGGSSFGFTDLTLLSFIVWLRRAQWSRH